MRNQSLSDKACTAKIILDAQRAGDDRPSRTIETGEWEFKSSTPEPPGLPLTPSVDLSPQALLDRSAPTPWTVRVAKRGGKHHIMDEAGREVCTVLTGEVDALLIAKAVNSYRDLLDNAAAADAIIDDQRAEILRLQGRK